MLTESLLSTLLDRRHLLKLAGAAGLPLPSQAAPAAARRQLDFRKPEDNVYAWLKIYGDIAGNVEVYNWFGGDIYAFVGNRRPLPILGFEGFAVNRLVPQENGDYRVFINEVAFYKDLATDEIVDTWDNPFNGETVDVWQLHAGPLTNVVTTVRERELPDGGIEETPFILPWFVMGDDAFMSIEFNDVRENPMKPDRWPRESAGEQIRVSESMQFMAKLADLENPEITQVATAEEVEIRPSIWSALAGVLHFERAILRRGTVLLVEDESGLPTLIESFEPVDPAPSEDPLRAGLPSADEEEIAGLTGPFGNSTRQNRVSGLVQSDKTDRPEDRLP